MKNSKKFMAGILCIVLGFATVLTGCGGDGTAGDTDTADTGGETGAGVTLDPEKEYKILLNEQVAETSDLGVSEIRAVERIAERTNNKVNIEIHWNSTLLDAANQYAGVAQGMAEMSFYQIDANPGVQVLMPIYSLPAVGTRPSPDILLGIYQEFFDAHPEFQKENHDKNVHFLMVNVNPPSILHGRDKVVRQPEDLMGQKVISTARYSPMISATGSSLQMPVSEYFSAIEKGVAECQMTHFPAADIFGTLELLTTHTFAGENFNSGFGNQGLGFIVNLDFWNTLPAEYQQIIREEFITAMYENQLTSVETLNELKAEVEARGDELIYLNEEELGPWREAAQLSVDTWLDEVEAAGYERSFGEELYRDLMYRIAAAQE